MQIIKPYGRSHVEENRAAGTRRVLSLRLDPEKRMDIVEFARSHEKLVVAQWISTIDKIASKPAGENGPTEEQRAFRQRLGDAAWTLLEAKGLLPGVKQPEVKQQLAKLWKVKIAPYGTARYRAEKNRKPPSVRGRWYDHFSEGVADVANVDAAEVAKKIHEHLYIAGYRIGTGVRNRRQGHIAARAKSIAVNVLRTGLPAYGGGVGAGWMAEDRDSYAKAGNFVQEIRLAAERRERGEDKAGTLRVTSSIAGKALFEHYARLFKRADGKALSIREARERTPGLFNLHMAVKDCYSRILKNHKKDLKAHGDRRRKVSALLPSTMDGLFALLDAKRTNRDLNTLVRLGKVIHYKSSGGVEDWPSDPVHNWPADVTRSFFWTSDGQAIMKRNEAFVRVWRHVLALASRTLTDWADPDGKIRSDILLSGPIERATGDCFDNGNYARKLALLFGSRADIFQCAGDDAVQKNVLRHALEGIAGLRHSSFHFKGLGGFADALTRSQFALDENVIGAVRQLWQADVGGRAGQLLKTMRAAHFEYFLGESQNRKLLAVLSNAESALIPLPRFSKMLERAQNAWRDGKDGLRLPKPANRTDRENPARLCQYAALKLLYERAFRNWLYERSAESLNRFIDRAVERATAAARDLNARDDEDRRDIIVAKAATLGRLADGETVETFFFKLSAQTASEMRVQRGYDSDADRAREQAGYIENLKSDVVVLAFGAYLKEASFDFLLKLSPDAPKPEKPLCILDGMRRDEGDRPAENWQMTLYFLIHLVPVDEIGKLLHQMRKWESLAAKPVMADPDRRQLDKSTIADNVRKVQSVLELYLDMHDAKFDGEAALIGTGAFKKLYEPEDLFDRIFPRQFGADDDRRIPRRGLREIMRFGHLQVLRPVFQKHPIQLAKVEKFFAAEERQDEGKSVIARQQERREILHEKWARNKKGFSADDRQAYEEALAAVIRYRHLAAHVTLTDHVRLHRLLMIVLGRLVDYSGLWERDLYFVALALIYEVGCRPEDVFEKEGLEFLKNGRIVGALRKLKQTSAAHAVVDRLSRHFGAVHGKENRAVEIRNGFAHFDMLRSTNRPVDLTACVNDARNLMAYDRKLKNAVSQSIAEFLSREGLVIAWAITPDHRLGTATLETRQARHLGGSSILEDLHGNGFVQMVAALFDRCTPRRPSGGENQRGGKSAPGKSRAMQNHESHRP